MKTILPLMMLLSIVIYSQNPCYEESEGDYWPFHADPQNYYTPKDGFSYVYSLDSLKLNGKYYKTRTKKYKSGKTLKAYFRKENNSVYYYNEKTQSPSLLMPANKEKGFMWESTCGQFTYIIKSLDAKLNTPYCNFKELLEIEILNKDIDKKFQFFYKPGVGFIGKSIENKPYSFIKANAEVENKSIIAYGCEHIEDEKIRRKCTNSKIIKFIRENVKNPTPTKHGKVNYSITIDKKGKVDKVEITSSKGVTRKQEMAGQKALKNLPRFIPAYVGDKPIRFVLGIPLNF